MIHFSLPLLAPFKRAHAPLLRGKFMTFHRDEEACWLDDLKPVTE